MPRKLKYKLTNDAAKEAAKDSGFARELHLIAQMVMPDTTPAPPPAPSSAPALIGQPNQYNNSVQNKGMSVVQPDYFDNLQNTITQYPYQLTA